MAEEKKKPAKRPPPLPPPSKGPPSRGPARPGQKPWDVPHAQPPRRHQGR